MSMKSESILQSTKMVLVFAIGACLVIAVAAEEESSTPATSEEKVVTSEVSIANILDSTPDARDYSDRKHCISKAAIRDHEVLSKRHVIFIMRGKKNRERVLIQFGRHCFGLHKHAVLNLESRGSSRLCVGDAIRTETTEFGRRTLTPRCTIPKFEPITEYQVELLKDALLTGRVE